MSASGSFPSCSLLISFYILQSLTVMAVCDGSVTSGSAFDFQVWNCWCDELTSSGTCRKHRNRLIWRTQTERLHGHVCSEWFWPIGSGRIVYSHLVDGESDGVQVSSETSLPASVFLHQTDQDRAAILAVVRIVIHVLQPDKELRVGAESGCREKTGDQFTHSFTQYETKTV